MKELRRWFGTSLRMLLPTSPRSLSARVTSEGRISVNLRQSGSTASKTRGMARNGEIRPDGAGDPEAQPREVFEDDSGGWVAVQDSGDDLVVDSSDDGLDWSAPEWTIDISLPGGNKVEIQSVNGEIFQIFHPTEEGGEYRVFKVIPGEDAESDAYVEEIDVETGEPLPYEGEIDSVIPELQQDFSTPDTTSTLDMSAVLRRGDRLPGRPRGRRLRLLPGATS